MRIEILQDLILIKFTDNFPTRALSSLTTIAESCAKLCLKDSVEEEDALVAIWLLEESVQALQGKAITAEEPPACTYENEKVRSNTLKSA